MNIDLNPIENLRREPKSAIIKRPPANLKSLNAVGVCQKLPANRFKKPLGTYKKHLEAVSVSEGPANKC